jgi:hypothetical protein
LKAPIAKQRWNDLGFLRIPPWCRLDNDGMPTPNEIRSAMHVNAQTQPLLLTQQQFFDAFIPLLMALHEKRVIDFAELPLYYEANSISRRTPRTWRSCSR